MKIVVAIFFSSLLFFSCSEEKKKNEAPSKKKTEVKDTIQKSEPIPLTGIDLFIEEMEKDHFVQDTGRLRKIWFWRDVATYPKIISGKQFFFEYPFPLKDVINHFTDSKVYYFVHTIPNDSAQTYGVDFLLMSYAVDSLSPQKEKEIYRRLSMHYINFPIYCIRHENRLYILLNRISELDKITFHYAQLLRKCIYPKAVMMSNYLMDTVQ